MFKKERCLFRKNQIDELLKQIPDQDRQDIYFDPISMEWKTLKDILESKKAEIQGFYYDTEPDILDVSQFSPIRVDKRQKLITSKEYSGIEESQIEGSQSASSEEQYMYATRYFYNRLALYLKVEGSNQTTIIIRGSLNTTTGAEKDKQLWVKSYDVGEYYEEINFPPCRYVRIIIQTGASNTCEYEYLLFFSKTSDISWFISDEPYGSSWNGETGLAPSQNAVFDGLFPINASKNITGNVLPTPTATLNLGSSSFYWKSIFLSNNTGTVIDCPASSGGVVSDYTFDMGGGTTVDGGGGLFDFIFSTCILGGGQNEVTFDLGGVLWSSPTDQNIFRIKGYNGIEGFSFEYAFGGWNNPNYGMQVNQYTGSPRAIILYFDNNSGAGAQRTIDFRLGGTNYLTIESNGEVNIPSSNLDMNNNQILNVLYLNQITALLNASTIGIAPSGDISNYVLFQTLSNIPEINFYGNAGKITNLGEINDKNYYVTTDTELDNAISDIETNNYMGYIHILANIDNVQINLNDASAGYVIDGHGHTLEANGNNDILTITNASFCVIKNCKFDCNNFTSDKSVINVLTSDVLIDNIEITGNGSNGYGIRTVASYTTVRDSYFTGVNFGIYIFSADHFIVNGNRIISVNDRGIYFNTSEFSIIEGNYIHSGGSNGIYLRNTSIYCVVKGNIIKNCTSKGIWLQSSCQFNSIVGNECYNNTTYGIRLDAGNNDNLVDGNVCKANGTQLSDAGTGNTIGDNEL